jgi:hypothetical protein
MDMASITALYNGLKFIKDSLEVTLGYKIENESREKINAALKQIWTVQDTLFKIQGNRSGGTRYAAIGRSSSAAGRHGRSDGAGSPVYAAGHASVREARTLRCCCLSVATTVIIASTNRDPCALCVPKLP